MRFVYLLARTYPYWALAMSIALLQLAVFFRRRENKLQYSISGIIAFLLLGVVAWFIFRGDINSDHWIRALAGD